MNEEIITTTQQETSDKFKLGRKWFWIGVVIALLNGLSGIIFGVALALEKKYRKEGSIIAIIGLAVIIAAIVWGLVRLGKIKLQ